MPRRKGPPQTEIQVSQTEELVLSPCLLNGGGKSRCTKRRINCGSEGVILLYLPVLTATSTINPAHTSKCLFEDFATIVKFLGGPLGRS